MDKDIGVDAYPLLSLIDEPADLRGLTAAQLETLAAELRQFLVHSVAKSGGHLAAGLGTIELAIALHYVYETPDDRVVWDVGHQTYPHKVLTGRRDRLHTIRKKHGLSGFPRRVESAYDAFGVAHAGTSVSAALGMAIAARVAGSARKTVAVIGDGALTAGMAFEALDQAGELKPDLLVILNDNRMSISPNVGALSGYLTRILSGGLLRTVKEGGKRILDRVPPMRELAHRAEEHLKGMVAPGTLFEELGFNYFGPIDGHDLQGLIATLQNLRARGGPCLLHVVTRKGKGYGPAESDPVAYHGVPPFDPAVGLRPKPAAGAPSYSEVFGRWLCDMARLDPRLVAITPAMIEGSGMTEFARLFPQRCFDVGIAEQHAVTLAAGLACEGMKPVVAVYSTFLQRAYDQLIHDVALQKLPVLFAIDRAGVVGPDGPTHAGSFDLSFMRCIPNLLLMAPSDENECRRMLYTGYLADGPAAVRYPKGAGTGVRINALMQPLPVGKAELCRQGKGVALLAFGTVLAATLAAGERLNATVVNMRFIKPLDEELIAELASRYPLLVTIEDNAVAGGAGSGVAECLAKRDLHVALIHLGLPDVFLDHDSREGMLADCGLDCEGIIGAVERHYRERAPLHSLQIK